MYNIESNITGVNMKIKEIISDISLNYESFEKYLKGGPVYGRGDMSKIYLGLAKKKIKK